MEWKPVSGVNKVKLIAHLVVSQCLLANQRPGYHHPLTNERPDIATITGPWGAGVRQCQVVSPCVGAGAAGTFLRHRRPVVRHGGDMEPCTQSLSTSGSRMSSGRSQMWKWRGLKENKGRSLIFYFFKKYVSVQPTLIHNKITKSRMNQ